MSVPRNIVTGKKESRARKGKAGSNKTTSGNGKNVNGNSASFNVRSLVSALKPVVKQALVSGGALAGSAAGGALGAPNMGSQIGGYLGAQLSRLIGSGDYVSNDLVKSNSMFLPGEVVSRSRNLSPHGIRIRHREYIGDISGSNLGFATNAYPVNPGLSGTFPWLSSVANLYERYHVHGMVFEFVSTTSEYYAASAMGSVIMAMQYDVGSALYTSKRIMENSDEAISFRPDKSGVYGIECKNFAQNWYYTRAGSTTDPLSACDIGEFVIATASPITSVLGELWVCYDIELDRPDLTGAVASQLSVYNGGNTTAMSLNFDVVATFPVTQRSSSVYGIHGNTLNVTAVGAANFTISGVAVGDIIIVTLDTERNTAGSVNVITNSVTGGSLVAAFPGAGGNYAAVAYSPLSLSSVTEKRTCSQICFWASQTNPVINYATINGGANPGWYSISITKVGFSGTAPANF